ncbi:MAG: archease [bacterium]|nr:archease [bacterium]
MKFRRNQRSGKQIKPVEHTADAGFTIKGGNIEELFLNALKALYLLIRPRPKNKKYVLKKISLEAPSTEELLVLWLNEIIFLAEQRRMAAGDIGISVKDKKLEAVLRLSEAVDGGEVKAATYHNLDIKKCRRGYSTKIFFDL